MDKFLTIILSLSSGFFITVSENLEKLFAVSCPFTAGKLKIIDFSFKVVLFLYPKFCSYKLLENFLIVFL